VIFIAPVPTLAVRISIRTARISTYTVRISTYTAQISTCTVRISVCTARITTCTPLPVHEPKAHEQQRAAVRWQSGIG
jgi:hypothetical protein